MKTKKQIIDSLFYEAFYFSQKTPVSEFEKYNEYAKNFAKSFNRLIKEIDDPVKRKEIIEWCITNDELLTIEIIATELSDHETNILKRNYGVLKNLFFNEVSIIETTEKPKISLNDFFFNLKDKQCFLTELKETFTTEIGIDFSILLWLLKDAEILTIGEGKFASFHRLAKAFFTHDIGSNQSINDNYKHTASDIKIYKSNIKAISNKLNPLIDRHKITTS